MFVLFVLLACDSSCLTCADSGSDNCASCAIGFGLIGGECLGEYYISSIKIVLC